MIIPKPIRSSRKGLIKNLDTVFSLYIRERDGFTCVARPHPFCKCTEVMQCNHLVSRSNYRLRWEPLNAICGCAGLNTWAHYHTVEWDKLWRELFPERVAMLDRLKGLKSKYSNADLELMLKHFEDKRKAMI
jgi:hypothetical protein